MHDTCLHQTSNCPQVGKEAIYTSLYCRLICCQWKWGTFQSKAVFWVCLWAGDKRKSQKRSIGRCWRKKLSYSSPALRVNASTLKQVNMLLDFAKSIAIQFLASIPQSESSLQLSCRQRKLNLLLSERQELSTRAWTIQAQNWEFSSALLLFPALAGLQYPPSLSTNDKSQISSAIVVRWEKAWIFAALRSV